MSEFIRGHAAQILAEFETLVSTTTAAGGEWQRRVLHDHAADLLAAIADDLEHTLADSLQCGPAVQHAVRQQAGQIPAERLPLSQLTAEYRALRASVDRLWSDTVPEPGRDPGELRDFHRVLDHCVTTSMEAFDARLGRTQAENDRLVSHLRENEERFRALTNAWYYAVYRMSPDWSELRELDGHGFIADVSTPASARLDGYVHPDDQPLVMEAIEQAVRNKSTFELEHRVIRADGTPGWTLSRAVPLLDEQGKIREWFGAASDITASKEGEEALRRSEATLNTILDTLPAAILLTDADGRRVRDNALNRELWGIPPGTPSWEKYQEWVGWWSETGERIKADEWAMMRALRHGEVTLNELIQIQPFGTTERRYLLNNVAPLRNEEERIIGGVAAMLDVTDRIHAQEALRESDRAKDEFLAVLGHELRNPLAPLRTGIDLLQIAPDRPELLDTVLPMMTRQLSHLVRLVDDLLDVSRVTRGVLELQSAPLELSEPIEAAIEQTRSLVESHHHQLFVDQPEGPLHVHGDFERLTQMFANLLSNAARYTHPGGRIRLTVREENAQAVVRFQDNGLGIPRQRLDSLFKLFSQIPEHGSSTGGGLGIGLALTRQLTELHGGTVEAHSEGLGLGSEFVVRLPLAAGPASALETQPGPTATRARRVLVVDDNVDAAEGLRMVLELSGYRVLAVYDGQAALEQVERFQPEAVLLDLGLPGTDGFEVARRIRAMQEGSKVLLIAVTGWGQDEDLQRTANAGFDDHLTKPVEAQHLRSVLDRQQARD